jgi:hypothetical protein
MALFENFHRSLDVSDLKHPRRPAPFAARGAICVSDIYVALGEFFRHRGQRTGLIGQADAQDLRLIVIATMLILACANSLSTRASTPGLLTMKIENCVAMCMTFTFL